MNTKLANKTHNWRYNVISEKCYHVDLGEYLTYGIRASATEGSAVLRDVSTQKEVVVGMTNIFNQNKLSAVHLKDAVLDIISC